MRLHSFHPRNESLEKKGDRKVDKLQSLVKLMREKRERKTDRERRGEREQELARHGKESTLFRYENVSTEVTY